MKRCQVCQNELPGYGIFCQNCGTPIPAPQAVQERPTAQEWMMPSAPLSVPAAMPAHYGAQSAAPLPYYHGAPGGAPPPSPLPDTYYGRMVRRFAELFDLHEKVASATILVDLMVFGGTVATVGVGWPVMALAALGLGFVTFTGQVNWHKDDPMSAATKAAIITIITMIPVPIATTLALFLGLKKGKK